jgi:hypothetical protein
MHGGPPVGQRCVFRMNLLPTPASFAPPPALRRRRATFRVPTSMHVPARHVVLHFTLEPQWSWLVRSFTGLRREETVIVPQWIRDADVA